MAAVGVQPSREFDREQMRRLLGDYQTQDAPMRIAFSVATGVFDCGQDLSPGTDARVELDRLTDHTEAAVIDALVHVARSHGWDPRAGA